MDYDFDAPRYCNFSVLDTNEKDKALPVLDSKITHTEESMNPNQAVSVQEVKPSPKKMTSSHKTDSHEAEHEMDSHLEEQQQTDTRNKHTEPRTDTNQDQLEERESQEPNPHVERESQDPNPQDERESQEPNPQDERESQEPNPQGERESQEPNSQEEMESHYSDVNQESEQHEEMDYAEDCATEEIFVVHKAPSRKTPQRNKSTCQAVRQSPRLAAIAKSIRRSNASRGLLPGTSRSSGGSKGHRRSLSEGSKVISHFTKVEKRQPVQRKMAFVKPQGAEANTSHHSYQDDLDNLAQTTQFKKTLTSNRQRANNKTGNRGPMKSAGPTRPIEFNFATDARIKPKPGQDERSVEFTQTLRSDAPQTHDRPQGPTKVKPFNLNGPTTKARDEVQPFISMAELNLKFLTKTPQRFRTKRSNEPEFPKASKKGCVASRITQPATPKLSTRLRARSVDLPTREEIEEKELEEVKKHQFKAKPFNKKVLDNQKKPVETTEKSVTVIRPFDITDTRKEEIKKIEKLQNLEGVVVSSASLACIPHGGIETVREKKATEVKPFSFYSRDLEMMRKKQEKIKKMIEEEKKKAEFHAHPMPIFEGGAKGLPPKKPPTPTKVQPFNLLSDVRGLTKQQALQRELELLEEEMRKQRKFEARPDTVLHQEPFIPQKSNKPLTDISTFTLNTDKRAEERQAFDISLKEKEDELVARKKELEERKKAEEEARIQEMRRQAVHKAQPIRHYKPVEVKQGVLPVTCPVSPKFATDQRLKTRTNSKMTLDSTRTLMDVSTSSAISHVDVTFNKGDD